MTFRISPSFRYLCGAGTLMLWPVNSALGQTESSSFDRDEEIVVIAEFPRGSVVTDVPPVEELNAGDIEGFGVSSVQDLLGALSSQTTSSRGRGSGRPIVLINGQRTSGFREIRDLPPEAIKTVQVFPEEVALQYGYRPDQRVINFILKADYTGFSAEAEYGVPTRGAQGQSELESTFTRIGKNSRLNLNIEYQNKTAITEAERNIIQESAGQLVNLGDFRTLVSPSDNIELNSTYSRAFKNGTTMSLNAGYIYDKSRGQLGLPSANLSVPPSSPFSTSNVDENLFRYFTEFGALRRIKETQTAQAGAALNGTFSNWRWSLTTDYSRERQQTDTDRSGDSAALQAAISSGAVDPTAETFGMLLAPPYTDQARTISQSITSLATISGTLAALPSGAVTTTFRSGYIREDLDSRDIRNGTASETNLDRDDLNFGLNIEVPLADENITVRDAIGKLSINGNIGYSNLSDSGGLLEFGIGLSWEPFDGFVVTASAIGDEAAPSIRQLGNPMIVTPDVTIFDFTNGETVLAAVTTGGNFNLPSERQRDLKLALSYRPKWLDGMTFLSEYFRNNSKNVASSFPTLTPEIEAAFPDRVKRDSLGQLIAIDRRPVGYSKVQSERIRYGLNFSKRIGRRARGGGSGRRGNSAGQRRNRGNETATKQAAPGAERPQSDARNGARRGRPGGTRFAGRRRGGRWRLSAYHTIKLDDRILIRPGVPELDLLNGSATGSSGGSPRHEFELGGGWFKNGLGFRVSGTHQSATRVSGGVTGSDLHFSDLTVLNFRMFINLDNRGSLTKKLKFLEGSRIALRANNLFDDYQKVTDIAGQIPLRYQRGFIRPVGRYLELSFRKRF